MATKTQILNKLIAEAGKVIDETGALREGNGHRDHGEWLYMTEGGPLKMSLADDCLQTGKAGTFTLFTRFTDSKRAKEAGLLERYSTSSKWNHHGIVDCDELRAILLRVTANAPAPHEQASALLQQRTHDALQRLYWKACDYNVLLRDEGRESLGYREQMQRYLNDAQQVLKELAAAHG